jgi:hypothetical protein
MLAAIASRTLQRLRRPLRGRVGATLAVALVLKFAPMGRSPLPERDGKKAWGAFRTRIPFSLKVGRRPAKGIMSGSQNFTANEDQNGIVVLSTCVTRRA